MPSLLPPDINKTLINAYNNLPNVKLEKKINQRYDDITNFNSALYQQYRGYLSSLIPQLGANNMIAPLLAGGGSYGGSQKIAQERAEAYNVNRTEQINKGVQEFALGNQNQASGLLGMLLNNQQFMAQLQEQQRQFDESQPSFWDSLLNIVGGIGGMGVGNLIGGKSFFGSNSGSSGMVDYNSMTRNP